MIIKVQPSMKNTIDLVLLLNLKEVGNNSDIDICVIIPAIMAKRHPIMVLLINGFKNK